MKQLQISIPKPCHQDWNQMTPEERGRFCSMCKKTVVDFSDKTEDEILTFIRAHRNENVCGRFRNDQLTQPLRIELPLPVYRSQLSFINVFLAALLFCFGTALFSCSLPSAPPPVVGEMEMHIPEVPVKNFSAGNQERLHGDTTFVTGTANKEERFTIGKGGVQPKTVDLPEVDITASQLLYSDGHIMGGMIAVSYDCFTIIEKPDSVPEEEVIPASDVDFFTSVYPNPSTGLFKIEFRPVEEQKVQLDLFDLSGRLVRNFIHEELMQAELRTIQLDISDQPRGIYFLRIAAGDSVKTERIVIADR